VIIFALCWRPVDEIYRQHDAVQGAPRDPAEGTPRNVRAGVAHVVQERGLAGTEEAVRHTAPSRAQRGSTCHQAVRGRSGTGGWWVSLGGALNRPGRCLSLLGPGLCWVPEQRVDRRRRQGPAPGNIGLRGPTWASAAQALIRYAVPAERYDLGCVPFPFTTDAPEGLYWEGIPHGARMRLSPRRRREYGMVSRTGDIPHQAVEALLGFPCRSDCFREGKRRRFRECA
jgi:hypothetical protein